MKEPLSSKSLQSTPWKMPNHLTIDSAVLLKNVETIEYGLSVVSVNKSAMPLEFFLYKIKLFSVYENNTCSKKGKITTVR